MSTINLLGPERPNSWIRFKENIASLISLALLLLRQRTDLVRNEKELNRVLYLCLGEANYLFDLPLPAYDGRNPPHPADKQKVKREDNRPDMYGRLWIIQLITRIGIVPSSLSANVLDRKQARTGY